MFPHKPIILTNQISSGQCQVNKSIDQVAIVILFAQQYIHLENIYAKCWHKLIFFNVLRKNHHKFELHVILE